MTAEEHALLLEYLVELVLPAPRPGERRGLLQAHPRRGEGVEAGREGRPR